MSDLNHSSKPATIREVAARAGVSTATVSRSLRGGVGVEPATRRKVEEAARELRYRPSGVARSLKLRATSTIGLIVTDIENPYFPQIVSAVEDAVRARGYTVLLADGRRDPERELESLEILGEREVDGMIIASTAVTQRHRERISELRCPVVIINSVSTVPAVPAVMSDNVMGGRLAAQHVLDLGHRRVLFVGDDEADHESAVQARDRRCSQRRGRARGCGSHPVPGGGRARCCRCRRGRRDPGGPGVAGCWLRRDGRALSQ